MIQLPSLKKNIIYNVIYQLIIVILPLITSPYLSRKLGAEMSGIYAYSYSIAYYFMMFGRLGITVYGNRSIAKVRDDKEKMSQTFCSLIVFQFVASIIMLVLYSVYIASSMCSNKVIAILQTTAIVANMFDITWFFFGIEDFGLALLRNFLVKVISFFLIIIFVNSSRDLWVYTLIMGGSTLVGQLVVWPFLKGKVKFAKPTAQEVMAHFKPNLILFIPSIAISVFQVMDKIMLGVFAPMDEVGFYEYAEKIISVPKSIITALGTAMLPRMSNLIANGQQEKSQKYISLTMYYVNVSASALVFGLMGVSSVFAPVYWGENFTECGLLIVCLGPSICFSVIGNVVRTQYIIPNSKDKEYVTSLVVGAVGNLIGNCIMIPIIGALGASVSTVIAELVMTGIQLYVVRNELPLREYFMSGYPYYIIGFIMFATLIYLQNKVETSIFGLLMLIMIGAIIFIGLSIIYFMISKNEMTVGLRKKLLSKYRKENNG